MAEEKQGNEEFAEILESIDAAQAAHLTTEKLWEGLRESFQWMDAKAAAAIAGDIDQKEAEMRVQNCLESCMWWMHFFEKVK